MDHLSNWLLTKPPPTQPPPPNNNWITHVLDLEPKKKRYKYQQLPVKPYWLSFFFGISISKQCSACIGQVVLFACGLQYVNSVIDELSYFFLYFISSSFFSSWRGQNKKTHYLHAKGWAGKKHPRSLSSNIHQQTAAAAEHCKHDPISRKQSVSYISCLSWTLADKIREKNTGERSNIIIKFKVRDAKPQNVKEEEN